MRLSVTASFLSIMVAALIFQATPSQAISTACPPAGINHCQSLNVAGSCSAWTYVRSLASAGPVATWSCVQSPKAQGVGCSNPGSCVKSGTCSGSGACIPTLHGITICSSPNPMSYFCACSADSKNGCQAYVSFGKTTTAKCNVSTN